MYRGGEHYNYLNLFRGSYSVERFTKPSGHKADYIYIFGSVGIQFFLLTMLVMRLSLISCNICSNDAN